MAEPLITDPEAAADAVLIGAHPLTLQRARRAVRVALEVQEAQMAARVRQQVAEEIAAALDEWARRQRAQAEVARNPQTVRNLESYAVAYRNSASIARTAATCRTGTVRPVDIEEPFDG